MIKQTERLWKFYRTRRKTTQTTPFNFFLVDIPVSKTTQANICYKSKNTEPPHSQNIEYQIRKGGTCERIQRIAQLCATPPVTSRDYHYSYYYCYRTFFPKNLHTNQHTDTRISMTMQKNSFRSAQPPKIKKTLWYLSLQGIEQTNTQLYSKNYNSSRENSSTQIKENNTIQ